MKNLPTTALLLTSILTLACAAAPASLPAPPAPDGADIVARHAIALNAPSGGPTQFMPSGPLLGNGDLGVMQTGPADQLRFYIGKNDFWSLKTQSPIAVGQLRILTPALKGASFKSVEDMRLAEIRGEYAKDGAALASRAWVDANRNLFCVELANKGTEPLEVALQTAKGATGNAAPPAGLVDSGADAKLGCEQHGGGRWFFNGEMADMRVLDRALSPEAVAAQAQGARGQSRSFDGKSAVALEAPKISAALTISGWIKADGLSSEANYIISKGDWDQAYSLGLSNGHLRFAVNGTAIQCDDPVPANQWVHVAGIFDGRRMTLAVNGKAAKILGAGGDVGADFPYSPDAPDPRGRKIGLATRMVGHGDARALTLAPGETAVVATVILSDLDAPGKDPLAEAQALCAAQTPEKLAEEIAAHRLWWRNYWSRSFIEIPDKTIEQCWYSSWYIMGSCSRAGKVAPGLWGNWITVDNPAWHGDWHLNYNFQAPFYGLYSANHADTTLPFYAGMNQAIPRGEKIAAAHGWKGIHLPVSIGPWGMCPEGDNSDWGQRSDAAYSAMLYLWYWQYTGDQTWLKRDGYAYVREVAAFWEDYLKLEDAPGGGQRYVIRNDAIHEGHTPQDVNGLLSLGLVRALFDNIVPMSEALGVDADKRAKWRDISKRLSAFPTQERGGKTVFRYTEQGLPWWDGNTLGIQHIFPGGAIGLDSDPKLLETSRNMIDAMARWRDYNGSSSWYTACARVGYDPKVILERLREMYDHHTLPNKLLNFGGGGIENVSPSLAVTEMLMQSHEGVIRFFPCWPKELDARFGGLRANGAFLVWAQLKGGNVSGVKIKSEKGVACTVVNPWPGKRVQVIRHGKPAESVAGERFTLKTAAGETLELKTQ